MNVCRICLSEDVEKDITQLAEQFKGKNYADIMLFCLDIKVSPKSKLTTKLCIKCYENIISFYKFKNLAQKNHNLLQLRHGEKDDKCEGSETRNKGGRSKENNGTEDEINDTDESENIGARNRRNVKESEYELFNSIEKVEFKYVPVAEEEDDWYSDCDDQHLYTADLEDIQVTATAPGQPLFVGGALYPLEPNFVGHSCLLETAQW